ncbi:lytic transglycosylase domain-containing protein [Actinoplanes friuliensis]|uniref:Transglycosylase SLT domain-containing protein n=1 Tax=Actinoplanes friuliensis DSM 7358 TaxID=1246995 RepID=U5VUY6_9ACTN|nr:lytic transglycosylase domain-containing protein [Actinoplanes friuliensis]AGZ39466.1 hypothetical protein AFR_05885 [Actinoplanes friuliensis DSM 7358]
MKRLWSRIGIRLASVCLLATGLVGGIYLGQNASAEPGTAAPDVLQAEAADMQLLKLRQGAHAAARAQQRQAEGNAAERATAEARSAAAKGRKLEARAIAVKKAAAARKKALENGGPVPYAGPIPSSCNDYSGSRAIGCALMLDKGFGLDQFPCLDKLWKHESGWNYRAENRSSGAYGIPQALPGKKMSSSGADWKTNPATQIKWGLGYIKGRYNTPCGAWSNFQNNGNY